MTEVCDSLTAELLAAGPYRRAPAPFRLVRVEGPEAADYLHRLCSQDVQALAEGRCQPAAFLDPKGKLVATCLLARTAAAFHLQVQEPALQALLELLDRYHFTEKLTFAAVDDWRCGQWVGAEPPAGLADGSCGELPDGAGLWLCWRRRGVVFVFVHAGERALAGPDWPLPGLAAAPLPDEVGEALRMAAGIAALGVDTEPGTLALEADLDDHVSLTKGCYTGQEIVARIHTYGHVNRKLRLLHIEGLGAVERGTTLVEPGGAPVGRVMSAVGLPDRGLRVALGYLPKDFWQSGTELRLASADGPRVVVAGGG